MLKYPNDPDKFGKKIAKIEQKRKETQNRGRRRCY